MTKNLLFIVFLIASISSNAFAMQRAQRDQGRSEWLQFVMQRVEQNLATGNLEDPDPQGNTNLHFLAMMGCDDLIRAFVADGADINARNEVGSTPTDFAAGHASTEALLRSLGGFKGEELSGVAIGAKRPRI